MTYKNEVSLCGIVYKEPKLFTFESGSKKLSVTLITKETWTDRQGQPKERAEHHIVVFNGKLAEEGIPNIKEGMPLEVQGKLSTRSYEKDGKKQYFTEVIGSRFKTLGGAVQSAPSDMPQTPSAEATPTDKLPF